MYSACMPNVQVRDVPDDVHRVLVKRAAAAGQSLQQYLAGRLAALALTPTLDEVLERIEHRDAGNLSAADAIRSRDRERARR